jgi:hypothetical protein
VLAPSLAAALLALSLVVALLPRVVFAALVSLVLLRLLCAVLRLVLRSVMEPEASGRGLTDPGSARLLAVPAVSGAGAVRAGRSPAFIEPLVLFCALIESSELLPALGDVLGLVVCGGVVI